MSSENEDKKSLNEVSETTLEVEKKLKISYTREFLLSLSNLEICKKLPSGFDESLLSEFEDGLQSVQDRPRMAGSLSSQGSRRSEYGSSQITRADSDSYPRGAYGRRGSQISRQSYQDSDSRSNDSDSGRHYGSQSRRTWQSTEHDGLLGSGSFPRPSGYAAGVSSSKAQGNEHYQLKKSNEPYQPPRPYKAAPYSRRDTDAYNDETFGLTESTSEDRAEEEKRRRAAFELMRKEQQKVLREKQNLNLEKHKADDVSDLGELLEDSREKPKGLGRNTELDSSSAAPVLNTSEKSSLASQSPASRPLVPPGFTNNLLDKGFGLKSSIHPPSEVEKSITGESLFDAGTNTIQNGSRDSLEFTLSQENSLVDGQAEDKNKHAPSFKEGEHIKFPSTLNSASNDLGIENQLNQNSRETGAQETFGGPALFELNAKVLEDKILGKSEGINLMPNLENIFGSKLSMSGGASTTAAEFDDSKLDDKWSSVQASKFSQWFFEEDTKPTDNIRSERPNDLLSLIIGGDKSGYQVSDLKTDEDLIPDISYKSSDPSNKLQVNEASAANGVSEQLGIGNKMEIVPTILTCEDLEQSILSEYSTKTSNEQPLLHGLSSTSLNTEQPRDHIDNHASGHLLSLLQKGTDPSNLTPNSTSDMGVLGKLAVFEEHDTNNAIDEPKSEVGPKNIEILGKTLTMEALFGSAFMQELQSVDAPVSVQRGLVESAQTDAPEPHGLPFPVTASDNFSLGVDQTRLGNSNQRKVKGDHWPLYDNFQIDLINHTEPVNKHGGFDGALEFQLPEEESLISANDQSHPISNFIPTGNLGKNDFFFANVPLNIQEKLAATNATIRDEQIMLGPERLPFTHGLPRESMAPNIPYRSQSSSQFQPPLMNHGRALFHPMDSHHAHMDPETVLNQESPANHPFLGNMVHPPFHHPSAAAAGVAGFDVPARHPAMLHQMQMPGNHPPPPHLLQDFTRGGPMSQSVNQPTGFIQEVNPMRGFPFGPGQPNIGSLAMPITSPSDMNLRGKPESFQRLIEMELQARSKQIHPLAAGGGRNQGIHLSELDMGFRHR